MEIIVLLILILIFPPRFTKTKNGYFQDIIKGRRKR
jgi:hypothetical protein